MFTSTNKKAVIKPQVKKTTTTKTPTTITTLEGKEREPIKDQTLRKMFEPQTKKRLAEEAEKKAKINMPITQSKLSPHKPGTPEYEHLKKTGALDDNKHTAAPTRTRAATTPLTVKKIEIINKENPHAAGSKRGKHWDKLLKLQNATTATYHQAGGRLDLLDVWAKKKHIKLS